MIATQNIESKFTFRWMTKAFDQYPFAMPVAIVMYENVKVHLYAVQIVLFLNFAPTTIYHAIEIA